MRFVAVVVNCSNNERRNAEALALLNYAVANYNVVPLFKRGELGNI